MIQKLVFFIVLMSFSITQAQQKTVMIDADTGNEVDDLYAIVRALIYPDWNVVGLNATQWQSSHWAVENSMEESHRLNLVLLAYLKMEDRVRANRGGENRLYDWGNIEQASSAAYQIIQQAHKLPTGEKLFILTLGALTNVASAILMDPSIEPKITVYWLGTSYDFENSMLKKNDFNCVMDIQAVEVMLNSEVEMHIFPVNEASAMKYSFQETKDQFYGVHPLLDYLVDRWYNHKGSGRYSRTLWDLAPVQALIYPDKVEEIKIKTSKENGNKEVFYYKNMDAEFCKKDFFKSVLQYVEKLK